MIFNNFSFPGLPFTKLSRQDTDPFHSTITPTSSSHAHQMNKTAAGRIFAGHSFALVNGIKPVSSPLRNSFIHTRPRTRHERIANLCEAIEQTESDIKALQRIRQRQKQNALIIRKASLLERQIEMEEHKRQVEDLDSKVEHWQNVSRNLEQKLFDIGEHVLVLTDTALTSERMAHTLRAQRDKNRDLYVREKELVEDAENRRKIAVSSIRRRCNEEKAILQEEIQKLREALRTKEDTIEELNAVCNAQKDEAEKSQSELFDCVEEIDQISDKISSILSEMLGFVLLRPDKNEGVWDKMRDLHDGIKDLVREVKNRREHSEKTSERLYTLEEERLMWMGGK